MNAQHTNILIRSEPIAFMLSKCEYVAGQQVVLFPKCFLLSNPFSSWKSVRFDISSLPSHAGAYVLKTKGKRCG
jgi:hypothetical protein